MVAGVPRPLTTPVLFNRARLYCRGVPCPMHTTTLHRAGSSHTPRARARLLWPRNLPRRRQRQWGWSSRGAPGALGLGHTQDSCESNATPAGGRAKCACCLCRCCVGRLPLRPEALHLRAVAFSFTFTTPIPFRRRSRTSSPSSRETATGGRSQHLRFACCFCFAPCSGDFCSCQVKARRPAGRRC